MERLKTEYEIEVIKARDAEWNVCYDRVAAERDRYRRYFLIWSTVALVAIAGHVLRSLL